MRALRALEEENRKLKDRKFRLEMQLKHRSPTGASVGGLTQTAGVGGLTQSAGGWFGGKSEAEWKKEHDRLQEIERDRAQDERLWYRHRPSVLREIESLKTKNDGLRTEIRGLEEELERLTTESTNLYFMQQCNKEQMQQSRHTLGALGWRAALGDRDGAALVPSPRMTTGARFHDLSLSTDREHAAGPPRARPQKFLWTCDRELEPRLAEALEAAMASWAQRDWPSSAKFEDVRRWVACLFGFGAAVWRTLEQEKSSRTRDSLVLCSADEQSRFYVLRRHGAAEGSAAIVVQYHGPLAPSSRHARLAPLEQQVLRPPAELTDEELRTEQALLERELRALREQLVRRGSPG
jgi:hypothetical protein